ncbi:MAG TPA: hypothetical protein PLI59_19725 [Candidatus Obscuribacter sp.]|nr:hypothetical protein [Candidatus Obscuribacter sp.]HNG21428.1 hypothetical protein [Candidatus Obscuribacter sp.]
MENTIVSGVNTAGTVRVNMLANLETLLNIFANGTELIMIAFGVLLIIFAFYQMYRARQVAASRLRPATVAILPWRLCTTRLYAGGAVIGLGLAVPGALNWMVAFARDYALFN